MKIYKLKVYHIGSCDVDIYLVMATSKDEAIEKLKAKGEYPSEADEIFWDGDVSLLTNI